jgi:hypothetical protein
MQPLEARKNPLWMYSGTEDADRVSDDLPSKDFEKLVRRFTSLSKNNEVPSSCHVETFSGDHALPDVSIFFRVVFLLFTVYVFSSGFDNFVVLFRSFLPAEPSISFFPSSTT